jgi:Flp pilus assembly protein TadB
MTDDETKPTHATDQDALKKQRKTWFYSISGAAVVWALLAGFVHGFPLSNLSPVVGAAGVLVVVVGSGFALKQF